MNMMDVIRAGATHKAGMTSLGAAKLSERALMEETLAYLNAAVAQIRASARKSECMESSLSGLADSIVDAMHDNGVEKTFWEASIGGMR